jgi:hypothetical protein
MHDESRVSGGKFGDHLGPALFVPHYIPPARQRHRDRMRRVGNRPAEFVPLPDGIAE